MNWHEPLLTPAQGAITFIVCLAVYVLVRIGVWFFREPEPEMHEHVNGDGL
ncbi:hypothetical protein [Bosea sp. AS-1]|uniref:hypothetical protein n=1 Tax=Bosea sp. AS-1 TaxID=2015316 RepID=UPI0012FDAEDF|nr:hypothetical protein [Bosea sp. AS-1]